MRDGTRTIYGDRLMISVDGMKPNSGKPITAGRVHQSECTYSESKTVMLPVTGNVFAFSHLSFATVRVQGPSVQILIDLRILTIRSALSTSVNIEPLKGEYR